MTDEALKALDAVRSLRRLQLGPSDSMAEDADIDVSKVLGSCHRMGQSNAMGT